MFAASLRMRKLGLGGGKSLVCGHEATQQVWNQDLTLADSRVGALSATLWPSLYLPRNRSWAFLVGWPRGARTVKAGTPASY